MSHLVKNIMPKHPLCEVFGFPPDNFSKEADRFRKTRLCPFGNKVPNCTKDKADNPLGVCSINCEENIAITCPIRFRQSWLIAEDAASFFFPPNSLWTSLTEVRLDDKDGNSAGNIDVVLVSYDNAGKVTDFGALEIQAVYISGNIRRPFEHYMQNPKSNYSMDWSQEEHYPRPDYLSSSRKRLAPQLIFKGGILHAWGKKMAVALDMGFYNTLPSLHSVTASKADLAWLVYDLQYKNKGPYQLKKARTVYTSFDASLDSITRPKVGAQEKFISRLQDKLDKKLENGTPPDNKTIDLAVGE